MTSRIDYNDPDANGSLGLPYHYELLADRRRVAPFRRAIARTARGRRVLESGAGSGIMSILAAMGGASAVYAVEKDPSVAAFTRRNIGKAGVGSIVRLIVDDVRSVRLADLGGERVNMVVAENLSTWNVTEPQLSVMDHINAHLAEDTAVRIPERLFHYVELAHSRFCFAGAVELRTRYFGFSGIPKPAVLSEPALFRAIDLARINGTTLAGRVQVIATRDGVVNSLRLTSPMQVYGSIGFRSSDSLMPPVIVPLAADLPVAEGDVVRLRFRYPCESDWGQFHCWAETDNSSGSAGRRSDLAVIPVPAGEKRAAVALGVEGD